MSRWYFYTGALEGDIEGGSVSRFKACDRVMVNDRMGWPGGYQIANWEGIMVEVKKDPAGYVITRADNTGYDMAWPEDELDKI